jgi:hypothetical protein
MPKGLVRLCFAVALAVGTSSFSASARAEPGDELDIAVLTMGPGDHPFTRFGHTALLVQDTLRGSRAVYNYGAFSFGSILLIPKFMMGKYRYWLGVEDYERTLAYYAAHNRSVTMQRLDLTAAEKRELFAFLRWNAAPENRYYLFDYYRDNCSTRVRDLLDRALGGALARASTSPASMSWRAHTQRLSADDLPVYFGLYAAMGNVIDRPISQWEEMFLPDKLEQILDGMERPGKPGSPLVTERVVLVSDARASPRLNPPHFTATLACLGTAGGVALTALGSLARRLRPARILLGILLAALGAGSTILGLLFLFLWIFTNHDVAHHNENLLQFPPWGFLLTAAALGLVRGSQRASGAAGSERASPPGSAAQDRSRLYSLLIAAAACSGLGILLKALPWFSQDNAQVIAFMFPMWTGAAFAARLLRVRAVSSRPKSAESTAPLPTAGGEGPAAHQRALLECRR